MAKCRGCGKEIVFAIDADGRIHPCDPSAPVFQVWRASRNEGPLSMDSCDRVGVEADGSTYMVSHFATCPKANAFSGQRRKAMTRGYASQGAARDADPIQGVKK